jgi:hypothetical protein
VAPVLDMSLMEPSFDQSTFSKNRGRLLKQQVALQFFDAVLRQADALGLLSDEHFTVDGTLIESAASPKSFKAKDKPRSHEPAARARITSHRARATIASGSSWQSRRVEAFEFGASTSVVNCQSMSDWVTFRSCPKISAADGRLVGE